VGSDSDAEFPVLGFDWEHPDRLSWVVVGHNDHVDNVGGHDYPVYYRHRRRGKDVRRRRRVRAAQWAHQAQLTGVLWSLHPSPSRFFSNYFGEKSQQQKGC